MKPRPLTPKERTVAAQLEEMGRVLLVRWLEPTVMDLQNVVERLRAMQQRLSAQPILIAVVPEESEPPSEQVRKEMLAMMDDATSSTESLHLVLEGHGLKFSALRSIVASMFLVAGNRRTHVHDRLDGAIAKAKLTPEEAHELRAALVSMASRARAG